MEPHRSQVYRHASYPDHFPQKELKSSQTLFRQLCVPLTVVNRAISHPKNGHIRTTVHYQFCLWSPAIDITSVFFRSSNSISNSSDARTSTLRIFELSYRGTFLIADVTLTLIFSSLFTASTTASMQYFTVSESVKGLFFFAKKQTRREDAAALSWAVQDPHHGSTTPVVRLLNSVKWISICQSRQG